VKTNVRLSPHSMPTFRTKPITHNTAPTNKKTKWERALKLMHKKGEKTEKQL
jgi:hypothetical protein